MIDMLKKDKIGMSKQNYGYVQVIDGKLKIIEFILKVFTRICYNV